MVKLSPMFKKVLFQISLICVLMPALAMTQESSGLKQIIVSGDTIEIMAIGLDEIPDGIENGNFTLSNLKSYLEPDPILPTIDSLSDSGNEKAQLEKSKLIENRSKYSQRELRNKTKEWEFQHLEINNNLNYVKAKLAKIEESVHTITILEETWKQTLEEARNRDIPDRLITSVTDFQKEIRSTNDEFKKSAENLLSIQNKLLQLLLSVSEIQNELNNDLQEMQLDYLKRTTPAIWNARNTIDSIPNFKEYYKLSFKNDWQFIKNHYKSFEYSKFAFNIILLILLFLFFIYLKKESGNIKDSDERQITIMSGKIVSTHPFLISLIVLLSILTLIFNNRLESISVLSQLLLFSIYYIALSKSKYSSFGLILIIVGGISVVNSLVIFFDGMELFSRLFLLLAAILSLGVLYKLRKEIAEFKNVIAPKFQNIISLVIGGFIIFLIGGVLGNIFGYLNISIVLIETSINAIISGLIVGVIIIVTNSAIVVFLKSGLASISNIVKSHRDKIAKYLILVTELIWLFLWTKFVLKSLGIFSYIRTWVENLIQTSTWEIRNTEISLKGILGFVSVIIFTYFIHRVIKKILVNEVYPRVKLPRGVPGTITMSVSYTMVIIGIYLALAAAGADFGKFTILAGALGVGIGFGLQNIVNNFISGIILTVERPIMVGDTIEVEDTRGIVKTIGVRASTIKLFDGSEVIIPNGNLISNNVTNWTLSDRKRRVEIDVGVEYGSDPNEVLTLLKKVGNITPDVLKTPECKAIFIGFGDSSLNFQLWFWAYTDIHIFVKSQVAIAIYDAFAEAGIGIPFPQTDLHVRSIDSSIMEDKNPTISEILNLKKTKKEDKE